MNNRRNFLGRLFAAGAAVTSGIGLKAASRNEVTVAQDLPSLSGRKILFTYGGWEGHEPKKFRDYLVPWMKDEGADVSAHGDLKPYEDADLMSSMDLVVQVITMSEISEKQEEGLLKAIKEDGMGMAGWHGGMGDSFRQNTEYQYMVGGQWVSHPGGIIEYEVNISDTGDPITAGISDFTVNTEQYYMHVDPNVKVLATTRFSDEHDPWIDGCTMPIIWKKTYGKGRIYFNSLGHNLSHVVDQPAGMITIKRGIQWASASKYEPMEKWVNPMY